MDKTKDLDEVIKNLKELVVLYGEITDELLKNLKEANKEIESLKKKNEELEEDCNSLAQDNQKKIKKIAELKQKKIPSIEKITMLMSQLQDILLNAQKQNSSRDSDCAVEENEEKKESTVFDLRDDKASDEDF